MISDVFSKGFTAVFGELEELIPQQGVLRKNQQAISDQLHNMLSVNIGSGAILHDSRHQVYWSLKGDSER